MSATPPIKRLGKYEIIEEIGRGGFGVVYRARDTTLNRIIALKVLAPHLSWDSSFVTRFQQEAEAAANLKHPNIVMIYELGEEQGFRYIAMEFIEGLSLAMIIDAEKQLSLARASKIIAQIGAALDYAHLERLIHRDVKPSNIIVNSQDHATLTDFGLVKASFGSVSSIGQIIGSPYYMSPEQADGKPVDGRTDLYSLGIVLFEMLTGHVPFQAETTAAVLHKQIWEPPPRIREVRNDLPQAIEKISGKVLEKKPEDRYQNARDFSDALNNVTVIKMENTPAKATTVTNEQARAEY